MQEYFEEIQFELLNLLEEKKVKFKVFKRRLSTYPSQVQLEGFKSLKKAGGEDDFDEIFSLWNTDYVWSFLDVTLLEYIVKRLGSDYLKDMMRQYTYQLKEFRKKTTVFMLVKLWPHLKPPLKYEECEEVILTLKENPKKCTLEKLEVLRKHACNRLKEYKLSEVALVMFQVSPGCITLIWIVHNNTVKKFKEAFRECIAMRVFFKENNITRLELDGEVFMPMEEVNSATFPIMIMMLLHISN